MLGGADYCGAVINDGGWGGDYFFLMYFLQAKKGREWR